MREHAGANVASALVKGADEKSPDKTLHISVSIAADAALGERDLRVVTLGGASNRCRFGVGQFPEVTEVGPNSQQAQAQALPPLPVVVNGQMLAGDVDFYRFAAMASQMLVLQVQARALSPFIADAVPGWMQPTLTLREAGGRELAYVDDFRCDPDPVLFFAVPQAGEYLVEVQDAIFRGREDFVYRLSIGEMPFITDMYPLGARRGTTTALELRGANLPDRGMSVRLPEDCPPRWPISLAAQGLTSNVLLLATSDLQEFAEIEPNDSQVQADKVDLPVTINGRIDQPGDRDFFAFSAAAGQELVIEVRARRLGSPLDSVIAVLDSKGAVAARNDDAVDPAEPLITHQADSRLAWKCTAAGVYAVRIADVQGKGGTEHAYRLTIAPPRPDFALRVMPDNPRLAPGGTAVLTAEVLRKDGFDGEVRLSLTGLGDDWGLRGATISAKEAQVRFTLTAPADVTPGLVCPTIMGTASLADKEVVRQAWPAEEVMQAFSFQHRLPTQELLLVVMEGAHFTLSADVAADQVLEVPQVGEATLVVKIARSAGVVGPIRLATDGPLRGVTLKSVTVPADKDEATVTLTAAQTSTLGLTQNLIIAGTMKAAKGFVTRYAPAIPIRIVKGAATAPAEQPPAPTSAPATAPSSQRATK